MKIFGDYSKYYDLIYQDKDYSKEADFVDELLKKAMPHSSQKVLELGSGTGRHAYYLAQKGYHIQGIDQSAVMLEMAGNFLATKDKAISQRIALQQGDIRNLTLPQKFDCAISLFHVMSYQTSNADLEVVFSTAKKHVVPGGIFLFDCWYGPAVLSQAPQVRYKCMENSDFKIARVTTPTLEENKNIVKVHFDLFVQENIQPNYHKMTEDHFMRYLFYPEIEALCEKFSMTIQTACEWLSHQSLSKETWGACFVIKL